MNEATILHIHRKFLVPVVKAIRDYDASDNINLWSYPTVHSAVLRDLGAPISSTIRIKHPFPGKWPTRACVFNVLKSSFHVFYLGKTTYRWQSDKLRRLGRDVFRIEFDKENLVNIYALSRGGTATSNLIYQYYVGAGGWTAFHQGVVISKEPYTAIYERRL